MSIQISSSINFCQLLNDESRSDAILRVGETDYYVIQSILSVGSPYFEKLFYGEFQGTAIGRDLKNRPIYQLLELDDYQNEFVSCLKYLYACSIEFEIEFIHYLYFVANQLVISNLLISLQDILQRSIQQNPPLAGSLLEQTYRFDFPNFNQILYNFIVENFARVHPVQLTDIPTIKFFLERDELGVSLENSVIVFLQQWIQTHGQAELADRELIPLIRMATVNSDLFSYLELDLILKDLPNFQQILKEAQKYQPDYRVDLPNKRNIPRYQVALNHLNTDSSLAYVQATFPQTSIGFPAIDVRYEGKLSRYYLTDPEFFKKIGPSSVIRPIRFDSDDMSNLYITSAEIVFGKTPIQYK